MSQFTPVDSIKPTVAALHKTFRTGKTKDLAWRIQQLKQLIKCLEENKKLIGEALFKDLKWNDFLVDLNHNEVVKEATAAINNLSSWAASESKAVPALVQGTGEIIKDPLGVVLIIAPFNYPVLLLLKPLVGAIAAGNCVVLKPSEVSSAVGTVLPPVLMKYLDPECFAVITGGVDETTELLKQKFDHIFYTGNGTVGRVVMRAAAEHLTPVTLELGGKSPCIIDESADIPAAVSRICWAKFANSGQTCVAPDYVLLPSKMLDGFVEETKRVIKKFYGEDPKKSMDMGKMVNERHTQRVANLLKDCGGTIVGGEIDVQANYVSPTLVIKPNNDSKLMQEEIFGPVLPILTYDNIDAAINVVNDKDKPLALYVFTKNQKVADYILKNTSSGGAGINECIFHIICPELPFGGVGPSGMGGYNRKATFDLFSHRKSVLRKSLARDPDFRFPPNTPEKALIMARLEKLEPILANAKWIGLGFLAAVGGIAYRQGLLDSVISKVWKQ